MFSGALILKSDIKILSLWGNLGIHVYGLFAFIGMLTMFTLSALDFKRPKILSFEQHSSIFSWMLLGGISGARILNILGSPGYSLDKPLEMIKVWDGGLSLMGGIIGTIVVAWLYCKISNIEFFKIADLISIYAPLFQAIARLGCLFAGCCYGAPIKNATTNMLCIIYQNPSSLAPNNICLYPAQLYSFGLSMIIFIFLFLISRFKDLKPGKAFFLYLLLEGAARAFADIFRGNRQAFISLEKINLILTLSQTLALFVAIIGLIGFLWKCCSSETKKLVLHD